MSLRLLQENSLLRDKVADVKEGKIQVTVRNCKIEVGFEIARRFQSSYVSMPSKEPEEHRE